MLMEKAIMFGQSLGLGLLIKYVAAWLISHFILLMGITATRVPLPISEKDEPIPHQHLEMRHLIL